MNTAIGTLCGNLHKTNSRMKKTEDSNRGGCQTMSESTNVLGPRLKHWHRVTRKQGKISNDERPKLKVNGRNQTERSPQKLCGLNTMPESEINIITISTRLCLHPQNVINHVVPPKI